MTRYNFYSCKTRPLLWLAENSRTESETSLDDTGPRDLSHHPWVITGAVERNSHEILVASDGRYDMRRFLDGGKHQRRRIATGRWGMTLEEIAIHEAAHATVAWVTGHGILGITMVTDAQFATLGRRPRPGISLGSTTFPPLSFTQQKVGSTASLLNARR